MCRCQPAGGVDRLMRVERRCLIETDSETVWKVVSDPDC
jgi:hypothetical protein